MSDSDSNGIRVSAPDYPDAEHVGEHLIIEASEWVPGKHPDPSQRHPQQSEYLENFYRCLLCRVEVMRKRDLPASYGGDA